MSRGSVSKFPTHLRGAQGNNFTACGNHQAIFVASNRFVHHVDCKNCLKIIAANVETKYFKPLTPKPKT